MKLIIASNTHSLLPLAWRLHKENHEISVVVMRDRFERCWEGLLDKELVGKQKARDGWADLIAEAEAGTPVLTDSSRALEIFNGAPRVYGMLKGSEGSSSPLILGAWYDEGEFVLPHLLVLDWGLWPGNLGPWVPGGAVLINPAPAQLMGALESKREQLTGHRGLVAVGLQWDPTTNQYEGVGLTGGWTFLHTHLFVSDLVDLGNLLAGAGAGLVRRYVCGVPVTVPPFPISCNVSSDSVPVRGLEQDDLKTVFFHDMKTQDREVWVGGTDGLLAVVRGSANHLGLARQRALNVAARMVVPQKQFRVDVGGSVEMVMAMLEEQGIS